MIVPFAQTIGIENHQLDNHTSAQNHLGSLHAGALYTLAENESGAYLTSLFPDLKSHVIALLREGSMKYKKQAFSRVRAGVEVEDERLEKFTKNFNMKNRATIVVNVKLFDEGDMLVCVGSFKWFVQRKD